MRDELISFQQIAVSSIRKSEGKDIEGKLSWN